MQWQLRVAVAATCAACSVHCGAHIGMEAGQDVGGHGHAGPERRPCEAAGEGDADDTLAGEEAGVPEEVVVGGADAGRLLLEDVRQQRGPGDAVKQQLCCSCHVVAGGLHAPSAVGAGLRWQQGTERAGG